MSIKLFPHGFCATFVICFDSSRISLSDEFHFEIPLRAVLLEVESRKPRLVLVLLHSFHTSTMTTTWCLRHKTFQTSKELKVGIFAKLFHRFTQLTPEVTSHLAFFVSRIVRHFSWIVDYRCIRYSTTTR